MIKIDLSKIMKTAFGSAHLEGYKGSLRATWVTFLTKASGYKPTLWDSREASSHLIYCCSIVFSRQALD